MTSSKGSDPSDAAARLGALREEDVAFVREALRTTLGISLGPAKGAFVSGRIARCMRELGIGSSREYLARLRAAADAERSSLLEPLCTHETRFFREADHYDYLVGPLLSSWRIAAGARPRHLRVWSAGCATGEEAYSLAMVLRAALDPTPGWTVEILGTDVSERVLEVSREALYPIARADEIPERHLKAFMLRGRGARAAWMRAGPEIRAGVRFARHNLCERAAPGDRFDAIFCRNVLIYFEPATRLRVVRGLLARLAPGGALFVGHAEGLAAIGAPARAIAQSVYVPASATGEARA